MPGPHPDLGQPQPSPLANIRAAAAANAAAALGDAAIRAGGMSGHGEPLGSAARPFDGAGKGFTQRGLVLGVAAAVIGLLTTLSGVVIELASDMLADLRHGVCVERLPGDTRPLWVATFGGGWRPYDRMRCCGGSSSVDHATEECRAVSIITHTTHKRFAFPLRSMREFGSAVPEPNATLRNMMLVEASATSNMNDTRWADLAFARTGDAGKLRRASDEVVADGRYSLRASGDAVAATALRMHGHAAARAAHLRDLVGADAQRVRAHMSHLFAPDPAEHWADEAHSYRLRSGAHYPSLAAEAAEVAVNADVVQTQSESAGSIAPVYEWVPWERALQTRGRSSAFFIYVAGSGMLAFFAAFVTWGSPAAKGSGIPEVKASVAGFDLPQSFKARTLAAKVTALSLCVGAGLAVGKEGPMIHIGACWGVLLSVAISRLGQLSSPLAETDLICVGAAAGVSAAFGAPLAGVLFAVEELGTTMPTGLRYSTMLGAFGSAVVAALALKWIDLTRTQRLTLFEVDYKQAWAAWEALPFCLLGVVGGLFGGAFVRANEAVHRQRLRAQAEGRLCWCLPAAADRRLRWLLRAPPGTDARVLEVVILAALTAMSNYPHMLTRMLQNDAIKSLFSQCAESATGASGGHHVAHDPVGLCMASNSAELCNLLQLLFGAAMLRFLQTTVTFGALTPAGLFVPSLYMGGCVGRSVGALLKYFGMPGVQGVIEPGIYAMVGAGAMLAGVSRLTISLAVVLFELTGGLTYVVPFMMAVLIAKWTGDAVTSGRSVYDVHTELNGLTKVKKAGHPHGTSVQCMPDGCPAVHVSVDGKPFIVPSASLRPAGFPAASPRDASTCSLGRSWPVEVTEKAAPVGV